MPPPPVIHDVELQAFEASWTRVGGGSGSDSDSMCLRRQLQNPNELETTIPKNAEPSSSRTVLHHGQLIAFHRQCPDRRADSIHALKLHNHRARFRHRQWLSWQRQVVPSTLKPQPWRASALQQTSAGKQISVDGSLSSPCIIRPKVTGLGVWGVIYTRTMNR